jgi:PilZ domain
MSLPNPLRAVVSPATAFKRDRRSYKRVGLRLTGRFLNSANQDEELATTNVSCDGAFILAANPPSAGEQVVCYFEQLGRVQADVIRATPQGFAVRFHTSTLKRDKLADRLTWLVNKDVLGLAEERGAVRFAASGQTTVKLPDGRDLVCRLTDISLSGAAFEALGHPPFVGDRILTASLPAEVVRVAGRTFAVRYLRGAEQG